jgi:hypothetical protein
VPKKVQDITGREFGMLVVVKFDSIRRSGSHWLCRCQCGTEKVIAKNKLNRGQQSCGCKNNTRTCRQMTRHGMHRSSEYHIWSSMIQRCHNKNNDNYPDYGEFGVVVCERWRESFSNFYEDVGPRPSPGHSIDRYPNSNGNYEPGNVRWATAKEQLRNRGRYCRFFTIGGVKRCLSEWCEIYGLNRSCVWKRLKLGWPIERALTEPSRKTKEVQGA